ncbi:MAG TPA: hypothetical protein PKN33_21255 [Phycisphaerae bacterium]|nr:hypothetical protein [Phycisphaerae bacterium]
MNSNPRNPSILAIDPGNEQSGWILFHPTLHQISDNGITRNSALLMMIADCQIEAAQLVIERIERLGMRVGQEISIPAIG